MKKHLKTIGSGFAALLLSAGLQAGELPSCDDLTQMAQALDELSVAFQQDADTIHEGDKVDQTLGSLVDSLNTIADAEQDAGLDNAVDALDNAWENMDGGAFSAALDSVILNFARLHKRDCG